MKPDFTKKAIAANIEAMQQLLSDATIQASEAFQAIEAGEQNQAIGAILDMDKKPGQKPLATLRKTLRDVRTYRGQSDRNGIPNF